MKIDEKMRYRIVENFAFYLKIDLYHEVIKDLCLNLKHPETDSERRVVYLMDGLSFVIMHTSHDITKDFLKRLYFILTDEVLSIEASTSILKAYYLFLNHHPLEQSANIFYFIYKSEVPHSLEFGFLLANFILIKNEESPILLHDSLFEELTYALNTENATALVQYIMSMRLLNREISCATNALCSREKVIMTLRVEKERLINVYRVEHLLIYGSYAKDKARQSSDLDLLVTFPEAILYHEQTALKKAIGLYLGKILGIKVDVINLDQAIANFTNMHIVESLKII